MVKPRQKKPASKRSSPKIERVPLPEKEAARRARRAEERAAKKVAPEAGRRDRPGAPKGRGAEGRARGELKEPRRGDAQAAERGDGLAARRPVEPKLGKLGAFRSGHVALVGRPNVGKSTILNQLLGQKITATTHKPQTTRKNVLGILNPEGAQLLLLDTPGFHAAEGALNRFMVEQARAAILDADVVAYVIEARDDARITPGNERLLEQLRVLDKPVVLLVNKVDLLTDKTKLLPLIEVYRASLGERLVAVVPISALKKRGLEEAVRELAAALPAGEALFPDDELTDQSERAIVAELIREKVILETREELPYAAAVTIDAFEDERPRIVHIIATVHVEKESQKPIMIGRRGDKMKMIGTRARKEIEHFLGAKVFLELHVRVTAEWTSSERSLAELGYGRDP